MSGSGVSGISGGGLSGSGKSMSRTLSDAARVAGGRLVGEDRRYGAVATDSRTLKPGTLFVALRGPNFDGRDFVATAPSRSCQKPRSEARAA